MASGAPPRSWLQTASHYEVLGVAFEASHAEIRKAYQVAARQHHPDKGGSASSFARVQSAWEVLGDNRRRAAYDTCAHNYRHEYVHQERQRSSGGEAVLLAELYGRCQGAVQPSCQLVVTCELCGRPATRDCDVCGLPFCSFCARRQHWRGSNPLHWPLVVAPGSMLERLGRREMEAKRLEDDRRLAAADPHHRSKWQLEELRAFNVAAALATARSDAQVRYDPALGRLYMWCETEARVLLACYLPNGRHDRELSVSVTSGVLRLGMEGAVPVIYRTLAGPLEPEAPLEVHRTADGRFALLVLTKATRTHHVDRTEGDPAGPQGRVSPPSPWTWRAGSGGGGSWWRRVFVGDSEGARCLPPSYSLTQLSDEVVCEMVLPRWVEREDVEVRVGARRLEVAVRGVELSLVRHYWSHSSNDDMASSTASTSSRPAVVLELSTWTLSHQPQPPAAPLRRQSQRGDAGGAAAASRRAAGRCLTICLARPQLTEEERMYRKGVRQDNRVPMRSGGWGAGQRGVRFFEEDEDAFGLEPLLQAASFKTTGGAWVVPPPWSPEDALVGRWVDLDSDLPEAARAALASLRSVPVAGLAAGKPVGSQVGANAAEAI